MTDRNVCLNLSVKAVKIEKLKWRTKMSSEAGPEREENR